MFDGNKLRQLRLERNLTQIELAKIFNTSHATINRYEKGVNEPDSKTINRFADYFKVSADFLLGRTDDRYNIELISKAVYDDPELQEFWDMLEEREDLLMLYKYTKKLDVTRIQQIIRIIKAIEDEKDI